LFFYIRNKNMRYRRNELVPEVKACLYDFRIKKIFVDGEQRSLSFFVYFLLESLKNKKLML